MSNSRYNLTACQTLERMFPIFAETIYNNVGAKSIGVDLSQQARYLKKSFYSINIHRNVILDETNVNHAIVHYMKFVVY
jgi:hypothetical protein